MTEPCRITEEWAGTFIGRKHCSVHDRTWDNGGPCPGGGPPATAPRFEGRTATYVQAWRCEGPAFSGYVYSQSVALEKLAAGCDVESTTIVRHFGGDREYLNGTIAAEVFAHREKPDGPP